MKKEVVEFYSSLRQVFGVCNSCDTIFRLSDAKLYQKKKPSVDWKEKVDNELARLDILEEKLQEKIAEAREAEREAGRKEADKLVKKIDPIFSPLKLNPNDAKVIFHPIDFIVFDGMNDNDRDTGIRDIVLLDKKTSNPESLRMQESIENTIVKANYEWLTLRVQDDGNIKEE